MNRLFQNLRYTLRQLSRNPGFTFAAILTLSLGIGANVAIFSIVNGIILRPLPVPQPRQIAVLVAQQQGAPLGVYFLSYPELTDLRKEADPFSDLFAYSITLDGISADNEADQMVGSYVTGNYFSALRVKPVLGRLFLPGEGEKPGAESLMVLGYSYWQKRFAGNPNVIGKQVLVDGKPVTIIGVTPKQFHGTAFALNMDGYFPLSMGAANPSVWTSRANRQWIVLGRLKPGFSMEQARSSVNLIAARFAQQYPTTNRGITISVVPEPLSHPVPLPNNIVPIVAALFLFLAGVILLLACVNVANLLLVRATTRESEMAIRTAMGASRTHLVTQVLTESILLAVVGGALGIAIGMWSSFWITNLPAASAIVPVSLDFGLDWRVLAYAFAVALCAGIIVGLWPALRVTRSSVNQTLREGGRSGTSGMARHRVRSVLVAAQMAGSLMLLIVAGLFVRSLQSAQRMYLGFEPDHMLNVILDPHEVGYDERRTTNFYKELKDRVSALPGVQSATVAFSVPIGNYSTGGPVTIEGHPTSAGEQPPVIMNNPVDATYFQTMKIPLVRGRTFTDADNATAPHVAVVNQTMANRFWPNEDAIGKRFNTNGVFWEVVGIAHDGKYAALAEQPQPYIYLPSTQDFTSMRALQIRTSISPESLILPVQQEIKDMDPTLPIFSLRTMAESLDGANGFMVFRLGALLASFIGGMGLALAVVGLYGVIAFVVSQRTREIGIRLALGASRPQVLKLVLRQGIWVVLAGAAIGLVTTFGISRGISNLLLGVSATDPLTFISATVLLLAVAFYSCYVPARRAMKVDPMVALRYE